MKKYGGTIEKWQMHTITDNVDDLAQVKELIENFNMDKGMVFTGTVLEDPTGRFEVGFHMRSSLIISYDKETGRCETANTIYTLKGEEGGDIFKDMGPAVMNIFY